MEPFLDKPSVERTEMLTHVPDYLDAIKRDGMSTATCWNYQTKLRQFTRYLDEQKMDFSRRSVSLFLAQMQERGLRPRTIRLSLIAIRSFVRYLRSLDIEPPPLENIRIPRMDAPQRVTPTDAEVAALFDGAKRMPGHTDLAKYRKRKILAMLAVFAFCGLRAAEALSLDLDDYDADERRVRVRKAKGGQVRWVPVNDHAAGHLADWMEIRERILVKKSRESEKALFLNSRYGRMGEVGLKHTWDELLEVSGLSGSGIVRHSLRHWFGTGVAREDMVTAKELLGHASLQTTYNYLHSQPERMKSATDRLSADLVIKKVDAPREEPRPRFRRRRAR